MRIGQGQLTPWDDVCCYIIKSQEIESGDYVVINVDNGEEIIKISSLLDVSEEEAEKLEAKEILRRATLEDLDRIASPRKKQEALNYCKAKIESLNLDMKLVDVHFSLNGSKLTFAFIADGRVDFRDLVKELTSHFKAQIRLNQIGTRDEAKIQGDCGGCGKELCCKKVLKEFSSITSEMAENQQVVHRGSDRISGMCGRLMCCLAYEDLGYKEMASKMPPLGAKVNVDGRKGEVVSHHILKQSVDVKFYDKKEGVSVVEVDLNRHKKKD